MASKQGKRSFPNYTGLCMYLRYVSINPTVRGLQKSVTRRVFSDKTMPAIHSSHVKIPASAADQRPVTYFSSNIGGR
jgi:hypothetical protein